MEIVGSQEFALAGRQPAFACLGLTLGTVSISARVVRDGAIAATQASIAVAEQNLDGAQVGACLQQVGRPTVAQSVRGDMLADAGPMRGFATCDPDGFIRNRLIESLATSPCGEQV